MSKNDELVLRDEDLPRALLFIAELVEPVITKLVANPEQWPRCEPGGTSLSPQTIVRHYLEFVARMPSELARLSREDEALSGEIGDLMERFADLDRDADDKHAVVFRPLAQLAPLEVVARCASTDPAVRVHSAELVLAFRRRTKSKARLAWVYDGAPGFGSLANVIALVVNGSVFCDGESRPFTGTVDARPLARLGNESADAMIARLASDMLDDYRKVIHRLRAAGELSAARTLKLLPFIVEHQSFGAPKSRGPNPPVTDHFVPGT
ncbi:MAG: hypothetical protein M3389_00620, partial [Actinomycetota bacterium]|nr:hypothetical protein [Actinomycetota bacterium]